jgi:hypothetical protein
MRKLKTEDIMTRIVLFTIIPAVGIFFLFFTYWIVDTSIINGGFSVAKVSIALLTLIFGLGILQFTYLLASKKEKNKKINNGVLYLVSVSFMIVAPIAFVYGILNNDVEGIEALKFKSWAVNALGLFGLGLVSFKLARSRSKAKQTSELEEIK